MPIQPLPLVALALTLLCGCTTSKRPALDHLACAVGLDCSTSGKLTLYRGVPANAAVLEQGANCIALAVDESVFSNFNVWNKRTVHVYGVGFVPPDISGLMWYEFRGRKVSTGVCDGSVAIYVDHIE